MRDTILMVLASAAPIVYCWGIAKMWRIRTVMFWMMIWAISWIGLTGR